MKSIALYILFFIIISVSSGYSQELGIIPKPVNEIITSEKYILHDGCNISLNSNDKEIKRIAVLLQSSLHKRTGLDIGIKNSKAEAGIFLDVNPKSNIKPEGYELTINENSVQLYAKDAKGLFYGIQTLGMILTKDKDVYFPGCKITDYPAYQHRGFMLDASRHFQSVEFVKKIIDVMAILKLNIFHWHLVDDEGWRVESKKFPMLNKIGSYRDSLNSKQRNGYYTIEEIKEIIRYAKDKFIKIIPEVEMPGHSKAIMDSYPEFLCPSNVNGNTYCAGNAKNYKFMKEALTEVINIFGTDVIHVGGDERPKGIWEKCPECKAMITSKGLADENMLQNYFMKDICDFVSSKGIKTIAWYENIKDGIPKNQIVQAWHPGEAEDAVRLGHTTINSDCIATYFDYPNNAFEKQYKPTWMPILELEKVYAFNPTPDNLTENEKKLIIGSECHLWTEIVFENDVQYQLFPRILAFTEDVWTPKVNKNFEKFKNRVNSIKSYMSSIGFDYDNGEKIINGK